MFYEIFRNSKANYTCILKTDSPVVASTPVPENSSSNARENKIYGKLSGTILNIDNF